MKTWLRYLSMGLLFLAVGCSETAEDAHGYYVRAQGFVDRGKDELALVELKNALRLDNQMIEALELQLSLQRKKMELTGVIKTLNRLLELKPNHLDANIQKASLLLLSGEKNASKMHIDQAYAQAPKNILVLNLRTAWFIQDGNTSQAQVYSDRALAIDSANTNAVVLASMLRIQSKSFDEAEGLIQRASAINPTEPVLYLMRVHLAEAQGQYEKIPAVYEELLKLQPETLEYWTLLANYYQRNESHSAAVEVMRRASSQNPNSAQAKILLGQLIANQPSDDRSIKLEDLVEDSPSIRGLRFLLAQVYAEGELFSQAQQQYETIAQLDEDAPEAFAARTELARLLVELDQPEAAEAQISLVLQADAANPDALLLSAHLDLLDGEIDSAVNRLRVILRDAPEDDRALEILGRAYLVKGSQGLAEDSFKAALSANPLNVFAATHLAGIRALDNDYAGVKKIVAPLFNSTASTVDIEQVLLQACLADQDWSCAKNVARNSKFGPADNSLVEFVDALMLQNQGKFEESVDLLRSASQKHPQTRHLAEALVNGLLGAGREDAAIEYLEQLNSTYPQLAWINKLRIYTYDIAGRSNKSLELLREMIDSDYTLADHYGMLGEILVTEGNREEAVSLLAEGTQRFPDSIPLKLNHATLLEEIGLLEQSIPIYEDILRLDDSQDVAANNLAVIYSRTPATLAKARALAGRFQHSTEPAFQDTLGWICVLTGELDLALPLLRQVVDAAPELAEFNYHLGVAYLKTSDVTSARRYLTKSKELLDQGATFQGQSALLELLNSGALGGLQTAS